MSYDVPDAQISFREKIVPEYKMSHYNRGVALIFNVQNFSSRLNFRHARNSDVGNLKKSLLHIGFDDNKIEIFNDLQYRDIINILETVAAEDHSNNDCILVSVLSYGDQKYIYATDRPFEIDELCNPLVKCKSLRGKPKIYIIQTSQGERIVSDIPQDVPQSPGFAPIIPHYPDFLVAQSFVSDFISKIESGSSTFINILNSVLQENGQNCDLLTLLTIVNQKMSFLNEMTCFNSMLTRLLYFRSK